MGILDDIKEAVVGGEDVAEVEVEVEAKKPTKKEKVTEDSATNGVRTSGVRVSGPR